MFRILGILTLLFLIGCGENEKSERPVSPRIKKATKLKAPKSNQKFTLGSEIPFEIKIGDTPVDSIVIQLGDETKTFNKPTFNVSLNTKKVGTHRIKTTVFFENKKETHYARIIFLASEPPEEYTYTIVNTFPHDTEDYTQGLMISGDYLYESTGQNGSSSFEKKGIESGRTIQQVNLSDDYFGEGLALINGQFYQLTYTSGACFLYNTQMEQTGSFSYQGEGWGLCTMNDKLLMTDGSEKIFIKDPNNFSTIDQLEVYDDKGKVDYLNELEYIDGLIYANIYQKDIIAVIDPASGMLLRKIDMEGLLQANELRKADVLNGIAYDEANDRIYVTGKLWPKLFEVTFQPKTTIQ